EWFKEHRFWEIDWIQENVFSGASAEGTLFPLIEEFRQHKIIVIGPRLLRRLSERVFPYVDFIEIHPKSGWNDSSVFRRILECKEKFGNDIIYSFSAGFGSNIFITKLHRVMKGNFLIDFGSVWDIFCGKASRRYMRNYLSESKIRKNLGIYLSEGEEK
ncbi:unnamed protein product, partial [marine sediment metagenome]